MDYSITNYGDHEAMILPNALILAANEPASLHSVQPVIEEKQSREDLSVFFGIGMAVNVIMIVAFIIWARKEWKKHDTTKK